MNLETKLNKKNGMHEIIEEFISSLNNNKRTLYNEDSFKFELAYFLRTHYIDSNNYTIKFEKNIIDEDIKLTRETKYETDLFIEDNKNNKYVIELKYTTKYCSKKDSLSKRNNKGKTELCKEFLLDIMFTNDLLYRNKGTKITKAYCINIFIDKDMYISNNERLPFAKYFSYPKKCELEELNNLIIKERKNKKNILFTGLDFNLLLNWYDINNKDFIDEPYDGKKELLSPKYYIVEITK